MQRSLFAPSRSLFCATWFLSSGLALAQQAPTTTPPEAAANPAAQERRGPPPSSPEDEVLAFLREQGLEHSQVMDHLSWICDVHGPRLTGSPNLARAQKWAQETLQSWGLENVHLESWGPFGKGWQLDHAAAEVIGENPWPVIAWPKAWSPSLPGRVEADVVSISKLSVEELEALDLTGKIVLMGDPRDVEENFEGTAERYDAERLLNMANDVRQPRGNFGNFGNRGNDFQRRRQMQTMVFEKKPLAILDPSSKGTYGTLFVQGASVPAAPVEGGGDDPRARPRRRSAYDVDVAESEIVPQFTLSIEHFNRIHRLLEKDVPVRMALELRSRFFDDDLMQYNVVGEIPGTDPELGDQVVMLGGHFDSWHSGTGATDNGAGSAVMMEAVRLLRQLVTEKGLAPRRTIRIALWSGEEQGLYGSRNYVEQHFGARGEPTEEHGKLSGYFNLDNGTGRIRGIYLQGNADAAPIFREWLRPFADLDASTITIQNTGGTDHQSFDGVGLPGFQFIQDTVAYDTSTHHSNMDVWDHAVAADLQQAAVIVSSFVWNTSQRDEMLPRKAAPEAGEERRLGAPTGAPAGAVVPASAGAGNSR